MNAITLKGICAVAVVFGIALNLSPEGQIRRAASLCVTAALVLMFLGLIKTLDWDSYAVGTAEIRQAAESVTADAEAERRELNRLVIERSCAEYILDKAAELDVPLSSAEVYVRWSREGLWVPERVRLILAEDAERKARLASLIEAELGIGGEEQEWLTDEA